MTLWVFIWYIVWLPAGCTSAHCLCQRILWWAGLVRQRHSAAPPLALAGTPILFLVPLILPRPKGK
ncbi:MAG: hypothetical protein Ct9H300mP16_17920 [Pseudomonadota bacterium]|nr:MAG: hypothetical protein Ct9H300mP16_17920 [Pseudomonadota bacterium]